MKFSTAFAIASIAIGVQSQGVPSNLRPDGGSPPGCISTGTGPYEVSIAKPAAKRSLQERAACGAEGTLLLTLNNGVLTDSRGRIGAIVANRQFQFDGPPAQTGSIYTAGWSICGNSSLAIGPSTVFYQCLSGNFYNLYDQAVGAECVLVTLLTVPCAGGPVVPPAPGTNPSSASVVAPITSSVANLTSATATIAPSGSFMTTSAASVFASQSSNGQIQGTAPVVSQITDGQIQATATSNATVTSAKPSASVSSGGAAAAPLFTSGAVALIGAAAALLL